MKKTLTILLSSFSVMAVAVDLPLICPKEVAPVNIQQALKWYRGSAEKTALYNQTYNVGASYIEAWVKKNNPKPNTWGVVLDIDETALDNSWYFKTCYDAIARDASKPKADLANKTVSGSDFGRYVSAPKKSVALAGAVEFTHLVHKLGGYVTFVSNRNGMYSDDGGTLMETSIDNLRQQNLYFDQVLLANGREATSPSDKNRRFEALENGNYNKKQMVISNTLPQHKIIAYFGDNIQDFPKLKQKSMDKLKDNDPIYKKFGNGYFIFPNPIYGSWENNPN